MTVGKWRGARARRNDESARTVDFLQSQLLCLADKEEHQRPSDQVQAGVEAKCARGRHDSAHARESQTQNAGYESQPRATASTRNLRSLIAISRWLRER